MIDTEGQLGAVFPFFGPISNLCFQLAAKAAAFFRFLRQPASGTGAPFFLLQGEQAGELDEANSPIAHHEPD
jgi:hypothetical protein